MKIKINITIIIFSVVLFLLEMIYSMGSHPLLIQRYYILGIPSSDISLIILLITYLINFNKISLIVSPNIQFLIAFIIIIFFSIGVLKLGLTKFNYLNSDIRIFLWIFAGIVLGYLIISSNIVIKYFALLITILSLIILITSISVEKYYFLDPSLGINRIAHPNLYLASGLLFSPLLLLINLIPNNSKYKILGLFVIINYFYFVVILSVTRSSMIIGTFLVILFFISYIITPKVITNLKISTKYKMLISIMLIILTFIFVNTLNDYQIERFLSIIDVDSNFKDSRFIELANFFNDASLLDLIIGQGFGSSVRSFITNYTEAGALHIGIFNFWLKLGFLPFVLISYYIFLKLPYKYIKSFRAILNGEMLNENIALYLTIGSLIPWILSLLISGGYGEVSSLSVGMVSYFYYYIKINGTKSIIFINAE